MNPTLSSRRKVLVGLTGLAVALTTAWAVQTTFLKEQPMSLPSEATIQLNQQGADWVKQYPGILVNDKNANGEVVFYKILWDNAGLVGRVKVNHGEHSFIIPNVLSVSASAVPGDTPEEGIEDFDINFAPEAVRGEYATDQQARDMFFALLHSIQAVGWKRQIEVSDPRLSGRSAFLYALQQDSSYSNDANYLPTLEEWSRAAFKRFSWNFYAKGAYLEVVSWGQESSKYPGKTVYLFSLTLTSKEAWQRSNMKSEERLKWRTLYPGVRQTLKAKRAGHENQLRAQGFPIDERYVDPDEQDYR